MVRPRNELGSLRFGRLERWSLTAALLFSLLLHLGVWGTYEAGKKAGWWQRFHRASRHQLAALQPKPVVQNVDPTIFLDVSQASDEAPKAAKYYSDKNSRAANADASVEANQPKLNGQQNHVPKTEDTPRPVKAPPATTPPAPKPATEKPAETKPATAQAPGTLTAGKPADQPDKTALQPSPPERPRTLREAQARPASQIPGLQMQQDGGVKRRALSSSLDAIATPFGDYDRKIVSAISQRWYDLLDSQQFADSRTGKVTVNFHLTPDGTVTELTITDNTVGKLLGYVCQEAIEQAAPFGAWPSDMRRMVGTNFREITFTFYYY